MARAVCVTQYVRTLPRLISAIVEQYWPTDRNLRAKSAENSQVVIQAVKYYLEAGDVPVGSNDDFAAKNRR